MEKFPQVSNLNMNDFLTALSGKDPVPGGGGAAALMGAVSAALGSMVANLTTGKKKYAQYQEDIERLLKDLEIALWDIYEYIKKDADAFVPLAEAYSIGRDEPGRDEIIEEASLRAALVPMELTEKLYTLIPFLEELEIKGSRLAISDVAVGAVACKAAMESAVMNIYINTGALKDRKKAEELNIRAMELTKDGSRRCQDIYDRIDLPPIVTEEDVRRELSCILDKENCLSKSTDNEVSSDTLSLCRNRINPKMIKISALANSGIDLLTNEIKELFFSGDIKINDEVILSNMRQKEAVLDALKSLLMVQQSIDDEMPEDFLSIDLMGAYAALGYVIGEEVGEDLVNEIFSKFCMGK